MKNVTITVVKKQYYPELAKQYLTDGIAAGPCPLLNEGNVFVYTGEARMPEGFCPWAWQDVYGSVSTLANGGSFSPWYSRPNQSVDCCSDGIRPVIFLLETVEKDSPSGQPDR